jgi:multicomponent K+:H+ antiporter subunit G
MNALPIWADITISALLIAGAAFVLIGSWGLAKLGRFLTRIHGPSKATTLGASCLLAASVLWFGVRGAWTLHELLIAVFLFITAPVAAHMLIKAALHVDPALHPPPAPATEQEAQSTTSGHGV